MKKTDLTTAIDKHPAGSSWKRGVKEYAREMIEDLEQNDISETGTALKELLLNGADDWRQYSYGGCSLICDCDIAERLCCPSELKRNKDGELPPNTWEEWLDTQARALGQACYLINSIIQADTKQK